MIVQRQKQWKQTVTCTNWGIATIDIKPNLEYVVIMCYHKLQPTSKYFWCAYAWRSCCRLRKAQGFCKPPRELSPNHFQINSQELPLLNNNLSGCFSKPQKLMWSYCTNTALEEGGFDLFYSFQVVSCCHKPFWTWKIYGEEMRQLIFFFFSKRKEYWNIEAEELSNQGDSNTRLVRETIADWRFFPGSLLRNGKNKHQC